MLIGKDKVVEFHYVVSEPGVGELEDSRAGAPLAYLHGHDNMISGIEHALEGKQAGEHLSVTLAPEQAYGERKGDALQRVSINSIVRPGKSKIKFTPGMIVQLNTAHGQMPVVVVKVGLKMLDVDANHPYAGKTLAFDIDIVNVRDASADEIAHKHAHAAGGHHHHG